MDSGLKEIAKYADAVGPDKGIIAPVTGGQIRYTTDFIKRCSLNIALTKCQYTCLTWHRACDGRPDPLHH